MKGNLQRPLSFAAASLGLLLHACGGHSNPPPPPPPPPVPSIIAINGGLAGSGTVNSLFVIDGSGFGTVTAATTGYSIDFRDPTTNAVVASASPNFPTGWTDVFITGNVPSTGLAVGATYKLTVTTPGGTSNAVSFLVAGSVSFSPASILWSHPLPNLPVALQGFPTVFATVGANSYLYTLGGNTSASGTMNAKQANTAAVYSNTINPATGALGSAWTAAPALPLARGFSAAVLANSFNSKLGGNGTLYVIGGIDMMGSATGTVFMASINGDGTLPANGTAGGWTTTTPLPQPLFAHGAAIFHNRIYVVGGNDSTGTPAATVYSAPINSDGSLGSWTSLPSLPDKRAYHALLAVAGNLYVLGGDNVTVDPTSNAASASSSAIFYNSINLQDGTLTNPTWTTNANSMSKSREKFTAAAFGGTLLVSGGLYTGASTGSSEESYATINADGSISAFNGATGSHTISGSPGGYNFFNQSTASFVDGAGAPHVLILGGADVSTGTLHSEVWYQH